MVKVSPVSLPTALNFALFSIVPAEAALKMPASVMDLRVAGDPGGNVAENVS